MTLKERKVDGVRVRDPEVLEKAVGGRWASPSPSISRSVLEQDRLEFRRAVSSDLHAMEMDDAE